MDTVQPQPQDISVTGNVLAYLSSGTVFFQDFEAGLGPNESVSGSFAINDSNAILNNGTFMMGHPQSHTNNEYSFYELELDLTNVSNARLEFEFIADIEFGFHRNRLVLFQIRPFLESARARRNLYLNQLDQELEVNYQRTLAMDEAPAEVRR